MLSYRHSFHAGNPADVLKHLVLQRCLIYLTRKDKPLCYIDTHAGAGAYRLDGPQARKTGEYRQGIGSLWEQQNLPPLLQEYRALIQAFNPEPELLSYPGSPWIAAQLLRPQDRLFLHELHATDAPRLQQLFTTDKRVQVQASDGFQGCLGHLPPIQRRGLVLIDPSYEVKRDYDTVVEVLNKAVRRFATGVYALWYPVVERERIRRLEKKLRNSGIPGIQLFELGLSADGATSGMTASGMVVINPPYTLKAEMESVLPWLARQLGRDGAGHSRCEQLTPESRPA
ncbi:MAG: 23S rRNA (adenine(2030)-N(6))-methyltransferase RlmJ [Thiothrix sp.]|nr:23S rRNA (adenine(2030)-N(6))-methyltransferase RlmJ [Thiothrix sp.]HPE59960.1 23S rRNA (adenine(2030)-N(6))-methyltransferase RlmJ [Thiolinea sp.]